MAENTKKIRTQCVISIENVILANGHWEAPALDARVLIIVRSNIMDIKIANRYRPLTPTEIHQPLAITKTEDDPIIY